jgi:chaperonin GroEL
MMYSLISPSLAGCHSKNKQNGNGTTMATVLASAICSEGIMNLQQDVTPWTPFGALDHVISAHITTAEITQFTTISANSDTHIGNLITQALPSPHFFY